MTIACTRSPLGTFNPAVLSLNSQSDLVRLSHDTGHSLKCLCFALNDGRRVVPTLWLSPRVGGKQCLVGSLSPSHDQTSQD